MDKEAVLIWDEFKAGEIIEKKQSVFVTEESVTRQEFYAGQQSGMNPTLVFKLNQIDYELTKHIEEDTKRPLYATKIEVDEAVYNIIRTYKQKDSEEIELICE